MSFLDNDRDFLDLAVALSRHGPPPLAAARALQGQIQALPEGLSADLVIAAYALAELPQESAAAVAEGLWQASRTALVLVEPGTPRGFARLRAARQHLLGMAAVPVAPCTHALNCPITSNDWCHFSVRLARSREHMHAKAASVPFEDERFAYLVVARDGKPQGGGRIIAPPQQAKPGITLALCTQGRLESRHVARRDGAAYKRVRKLDWGDRIAPATEEDSP